MGNTKICLRLKTKVLLNVPRQMLGTNGSARLGNLIVSSATAFVTVADDGCCWVIELWNGGLKVGEDESPGVLILTLDDSPSKQNVGVLCIGGDSNRIGREVEKQKYRDDLQAKMTAAYATIDEKRETLNPLTGKVDDEAEEPSKRERGKTVEIYPGRQGEGKGSSETSFPDANTRCSVCSASWADAP
jgi:hypothetical protein